MTAPTRVLVTGASGLVGGALVRTLARDSGLSVAGASRAACGPGELLRSPELDAGADWSGLVRGQDVVVHCAARVHVMRHGADDAVAFRAANVDGTAALARQAAEAGVRRFVFLSTVKVLGERSPPGSPLRADDPPAPADAYARSKLEAERTLAEIARASGMELVIVRPPLVYGPGVRANFLSMLRWVDRGVPLPFGAVNNRRSYVALDNLVDLLRVCLRHPEAAGQTFLVSDGEDLSTSELLRRVARALGVGTRLVPVPQGWLEGMARLVGRHEFARRLCGSLQVDDTATRTRLGWAPVIGVEEGLARVACWYRQHGASVRDRRA